MIDLALLDAAFNSLPESIRASRPRCGLVLGSGWNQALDGMDIVDEVPYSDIAGLGATAVPGHSGRLVLATLPGRPDAPVLAFCGRRHWYEGVGWEAVVLPADFCRRLGVPVFVATNAAGGIRGDLHPGDIVVIRDHLRMSHLNPLQGAHIPEYGQRFPDQSHVYDAELQALAHDAAAAVGFTIASGVYAFSSGPTFETPAEVRAYSILGADVVGMSTVPEVTVASACGMRCAALSLVSNMAAGINAVPLCHEEVLGVSTQAAPRMAALLRTFLGALLA